MFAVVVLSPNYASSSWCLDELCNIIDCKNKLGLLMVAVFYGVEPCDVRHQIGTFREAFKKHQQRHGSVKVRRWRDTLSQVADYSGWSSKNQDEAALVENIAQHIFEILIPKLPSSMKNLVGIESRVEQVISQIGLGLNDVRYIGIWGMGGIGKTTIARAVFETIRSRFDVTCFLADVREHFEKKDITDVQKQLLEQMNISSNAVHNKYEGRRIIQNSLRLKKVLLALDDVNHEKQLENLAEEKDWFGPGSKIIITTRDIEVLKQQEVHETYKIEGLVESEAFNLFCSKAFKQPKPLEEFLDLSASVINYSGGLPLALKVLGSYLKGRKKDDVTRILEGCGQDAGIGIDILINRTLVTLEENLYGDTVMGMHDLLEEMGKHIVIQESPNDASKRSRLWCWEDVDFLLTQKKEIVATQSMVLYMRSLDTGENWRDLDIRGSSFSNLELLILDGVTAPILYNIPCTLKVLRWKECPLDTLPFTDQHYELVEIDLHESKIVQLWDGKKFLNKLEHLNLSSCYKLKETPDLSGAPNLKALNLKGCHELNYIHPSLTHHRNLIELNLSRCIRLETHGDKLEMSSLKKLECCSCLRRLPEFGECMKQLSMLILDHIDIQELSSSFGNMVGLTELHLYVWPWLFTGRPISHGHFDGLKKLSLQLKFLAVVAFGQIQDTDGLLSSVSLLTSLRSLTLYSCFPKSEEYYKQLNSCSKLEVLPDLPSRLRVLQASSCYSLDASNVNDVISKACCVFAESATQDGEDIFEMVIPGKDIPAWFDHQEQGNGVSVSFSYNFSSTKTMALSLCFVFDGPNYEMERSVICCNGEEFINKSLLEVLPWMYFGNMCIVFLNGYYFSNLLGQHNRFHILFPGNTDFNTRVTRSATRWVCNQDIQVPDFKKRKATLELRE
ncbi:hypothetical protein PIB30_045547 [Stylosanthes scabra]|uniref:ADP-ribosyl cyclase/cyclic ADP-ribose hydrolase n=1 Tax=Stylosanthes scabra TaxID=79078 RepID=A0ABU6UFH8_9FABA|nr:hypothetical protein [Stylosanthes scabra]